jgi:hypothetical protein
VYDLLVGIFVIGLLASLVFVMAMRASRRLEQRMIHLLGILVVTMIVTYVVHVQGHPGLSHVLPFSNLIVLSNWQPLLVSALAGLLWHRLPAQLWRRSVATMALVGVCLLSVYRPILAQPPKLNDRWDGPVCLQTSQASCSPAAAATLLRWHGIEASEQEMALLCLTSPEGTPTLGLYRGLKLKTAGTPWDVYMFADGKIDDLRGVGPVLLSVELRPEMRTVRELQGAGFLVGVPHSVVLMGFIGESRVAIADPSMGREIWSLDDLRLLWQGEGVRLVRAQ